MKTREREPAHLASQISSTVGESVREVRRQAGPWPSREAAAQRAVLLLLLLGLLTGPVALGLGLIAINRSTTAPVSASPPADLSNDRQLAAAAATRFIRIWWQATDKDREALDQMLLRGAAGAQLPTKPRPAPAAVDVVSVQPYQSIAGTWRVKTTVWPDTGTPSDLEVLVQLIDGQAAILQLPSVVGAPRPAAVERPQSETLLEDDPRTKAAVGFLSSWLGGRDDVARWTVPTWQPATAGPLCASTSLVRATGDPSSAPGQPHAEQTVSIQITCTAGAGNATALAYDLTLTWGGGQWAVSAINGSTGSSTEGKNR